MPDPAIIPLKSSHLIILEESAEVLRLRTRMVSWWMGSAGMLFLLAVAGKGLWRLGDEVLAGRWLAAGAVCIGYGLGVAFLALFANGLTHQRLGIEHGRLHYAWRLGPLPLRHHSALVEDVCEISCEMVASQEQSDVYFLEITACGWRARFASETSDITLREVLAKMRKLGVRTKAARARPAET